MRSHSAPTFAAYLVVSLAVPLAACSNVAHDEAGDPPADAGAPSALGNGLHIAPMNDPSSSVRPVNNQANVAVTGATFIVKDSYSETGLPSSVGNIYVQDFHAPDAAAPPFSGILLYKPTFVPASLALAPGDVIDFTGTYSLYDGPSSFSFGPDVQPEMNDPIVTFRFDYGPPTPTVIPVTDLESYAKGYQWMSMLVTVLDTDGGQSTENRGDPCQVYITPDTGQGAVAMDNELFDLPCPSPMFNRLTDAGQPAPGGFVHFKSITGVVTYFDSFTISPRSMADIVIE